MERKAPGDTFYTFLRGAAMHVVKFARRPTATKILQKLHGQPWQLEGNSVRSAKYVSRYFSKLRQSTNFDIFLALLQSTMNDKMCPISQFLRQIINIYRKSFFTSHNILFFSDCRSLIMVKKFTDQVQGVSGTETKNFDSSSGIAGTGILVGRKPENQEFFN